MIMARGRPRKVVSEATEKNNMLDNMIKSEDDSSIDENVEKRPAISSPEWNDYVLSLLTDDEFDERVAGVRLPKTDGLGRLVKLLFAGIIFSKTKITHITQDGVIASHTIAIMANDQYVSYTAVADATENNTDPPYNKFLTAVASTRARGRAYRDMLGLKNVPVAEELSEKAESDVMATSAQKVAINNLCDQLKINIQKFLDIDFAYTGADADLNKINKNDATRALARLHDYKHGVREIIPEIKGE
jgi:hypothetical protein